MIVGASITGIDTVLKELQAAIDKRGTVFRKGVIAAGLTLEATCTKKITEVLYSIPEDDDKERRRTGNLRASRFTMWTNHPNVDVPTFDVIKGEEPVLPGFRQAMYDAAKIVDDASRDDRTAVVVGYGAYYAIYVHEGVEGKFHGFKWMELALLETRDTLLDLITRGGATA